MSNLSSFTSGIKSIQRGTISLNGVTSATATVTAVDTAKTELRMLGYKGVIVDFTATPYIVLTNTTTVTATRTSSAADSCAVSWELTEWN